MALSHSPDTVYKTCVSIAVAVWGLLRPERTVSLLESLDKFLASGSSKNQGYNRFGHLKLPHLEKVAESWAQELDLFWIEAKEDVS